jgi:hypothetical protein
MNGYGVHIEVIHEWGVIFKLQQQPLCTI